MISTGWSFWLLGWLVRRGLVPLTTWTVLAASRLPGFLGSFVVDTTLSRCNKKSASRCTGRLLWASSWLELVMYPRPFGNSFIEITMAPLLVRLIALHQKGTLEGAPLLIGALCIAGIFVHLTFIHFLAPICLLTLISQL